MCAIAGKIMTINFDFNYYLKPAVNFHAVIKCSMLHVEDHKMGHFKSICYNSKFHA